MSDEQTCVATPAAGGPSRSMPLGPLARAAQVGLVLAVLFWWGFAVLTSGPDLPYDLRACSVFFQAASSAACIVLLQLRARAARPAVVLSLSADAAFCAATGLGLWPAPLGMAPWASAAGAVVCLAVALYFAGSRRMAAVLVRSLARTPEQRARQLAAARMADIHSKGRGRRRLRLWPWWRNLLIHFCAFSILGHWAEMLFCQLIRLGIVAGSYDLSNYMLWNEWLYPFPAEGIAVVLIVVLLHPLAEWLLDRCGGRRVPAIALSFLANALVCTSIDFTTGITANADHHLWDYSDLPFNFMGQICLQNSMVYSVAATVFVWAVYPAMERLVHRPPDEVMDVAFAGFVTFWIFLYLLYYVTITPTGIVIG
ncbi:MAG: putative ABC transporter permease [Atopobiaceae bacterium]|nr:putative ABC transporter permease [Atopobiaceae bacterium]